MKPPARSLSRWVTVPLAAALALTGCSDTGGGAAEKSGASAEKRLHPTPAPQPDPQAIAKVDELLNPDPATEAARVKVALQCLKSKGLTLTLNPLPRRSIDESASLSLEDARIYGYDKERAERIKAEQDGHSSAEFHPAYMGDDKGEQIRVNGLTGSWAMMSTDSCLARSLKEIYGSVEDGSNAGMGSEVHNLFSPAVAEADASEPVRSLNREWGACMKARGWDFESSNFAHIAADRQPAEAKEIAVADVSCQAEVKYTPRYRVELAKYLTTALKQNEDIIIRLRDIRKRGAENAAARK